MPDCTAYSCAYTRSRVGTFCCGRVPSFLTFFTRVTSTQKVHTSQYKVRVSSLRVYSRPSNDFWPYTYYISLCVFLSSRIANSIGMNIGQCIYVFCLFISVTCHIEFSPVSYSLCCSPDSWTLTNVPRCYDIYGTGIFWNGIIPFFFGNHISLNFTSLLVGSSVADPDPNPDPYFFGPPGSGSIGQSYGSGSF